MTEKRFTWNSKEVVIDDNVTGDQLEVIDITEIDVLIDLLNAQHEEIQQLKFILQNTCEQRDEFFRGARENANCVGKLEEENEQLKQQLRYLEYRFTEYRIKLGDVE